MIDFLSMLLAFAIFCNSLLFWPVDRLFHPNKTKRRQDLLAVFIVAICLYVGLTGFAVWCIYFIKDFHHAFLLVYAAYIVLDIGCWITLLSAPVRVYNYEHYLKCEVGNAPL